MGKPPLAPLDFLVLLVVAVSSLHKIYRLFGSDTIFESLRIAGGFRAVTVGNSWQRLTNVLITIVRLTFRAFRFLCAGRGTQIRAFKLHCD
jgi:hypothetical protein